MVSYICCIHKSIRSRPKKKWIDYFSWLEIGVFSFFFPFKIISQRELYLISFKHVLLLDFPKEIKRTTRITIFYSNFHTALSNYSPFWLTGHVRIYSRCICRVALHNKLLGFVWTYEIKKPALLLIMNNEQIAIFCPNVWLTERLSIYSKSNFKVKFCINTFLEYYTIGTDEIATEIKGRRCLNLLQPEYEKKSPSFIRIFSCQLTLTEVFKNDRYQSSIR